MGFLTSLSAAKNIATSVSSSFAKAVSSIGSCFKPRYHTLPESILESSLESKTPPHLGAETELEISPGHSRLAELERDIGQEKNGLSVKLLPSLRSPTLSLEDKKRKVLDHLSHFRQLQLDTRHVCECASSVRSTGCPDCSAIRQDATTMQRWYQARGNIQQVTAILDKLSTVSEVESINSRLPHLESQIQALNRTLAGH
ncbi:hypothetical protein EIP91_005156 [Steccherinum ochraceum]|uniref:Uncharacterized protein n=1 Tax=Steccherinum ochraceum TaxID=92696 RepID=A0A4R0RFY8_9APHY|nr:hypothetical protein EIP91_005156 [Steccherinum ochraceum]